MRKVQLQWWIALFSKRASSRPRRRRLPSWHAEELHERLLLSALTPAQVAHAYGVDQIAFGTVKGDGTGQTIAIVDAYDAPNLSTDLAAFDAANGIRNTDGQGNAVFTKAQPEGTPVGSNSTWAEEITLDVEWAHAIAPGAHILLVEAASNSFTNLMGAVSYASSQPGVSVVSMSWGMGEFSTETLSDSYFTTPSGHTGVVFVASAGDSGGVTEWPAVSPNVVAVGGTNLNIADSSGTYGSETAWSGSGGGISGVESKPSYQSSVTQSSTMRAGPDVAWVAANVEIYFNGGWTTVGGTSCGAPQVAALIAIADQGRAINGKTPLDGPSQVLPALYSMSSSDFHDITSGTAGSYTATAGYDLITGRGTPVANLLVNDLLSIASWSGGSGGTSGGTGGGTSGGTTGGGTTGGSGRHGKTKVTSAPKIVDFAELAAGQNLALSELQQFSDGSSDAGHQLWQHNHLYIGSTRIA